jgi:hypothetical protein
MEMVLNAHQEEYLAFLKKRDAYFDDQYLWDQLCPIIPYPTGRFFGGTLPGTSRQATIMLSLWDEKIPRRGFDAYGLQPGLPKNPSAL